MKSVTRGGALAKQLPQAQAVSNLTSVPEMRRHHFLWPFWEHLGFAFTKVTR